MKKQTMPCFRHDKQRARCACAVMTLAVTACTVALAVPSTRAMAAYPNRPIRVVVPVAPGGTTDIITRALAQHLTENLKTQVVVDNRGGGAQVIGTDIVAKSAPNGYTLLLTSMTHATTPSLLAKLPYDSIKDFTTVELLASSAGVVVVHPTLPVHNMAELVKLLKANPGKYNYAASSIGSGGHLAGELFKDMAKVTMTFIPYKGNGPATVDLLAGQIPIMFTGTAPMLTHIRAGRLRALAVTSAQRSAVTPDLPTIAESGYPGYAAALWYATLAPAGLPADILKRLNVAFAAALKMPDVRERFNGLGIDIVAAAPEESARFLAAEVAKWARVIKAANIRVE